jgi:arylsulfatase A-like enzyme
VPTLVRWPGRIASGSVTGQPFNLTDVMATCAEIVGFNLPNDAAEDSFSFVKVLKGEQPENQLVRDYTVHQTISLAMAIRRGPWKYLDHQGSGGNNYNRPALKPYQLADTAVGAAGQLYHLENDPGETVNLYFEHPEIVEELKSKLEEIKSSGRSVAVR